MQVRAASDLESLTRNLPKTNATIKLHSHCRQLSRTLAHPACFAARDEFFNRVRAHPRLGGRCGEARRFRFPPRGVPANKRSCVTPDEAAAALREMTQVESARYDHRAPALEVLSAARKAIAFPGGAYRLACKRGRIAKLLVQRGSSRTGPQSSHKCTVGTLLRTPRKRASRESIRRRRLAGLHTRAALRRTKKQGPPITAAKPQRGPLGRLSFRSRSITTVAAVAEKETNTRGRAGKPLEHTRQRCRCRPARRARRGEKKRKKRKDNEENSGSPKHDVTCHTWA